MANNDDWIHAHYPDAVARRQEAWMAHQAGETYAQIGQRMGISRARAHQLAQEYRRAQGKRLVAYLHEHGEDK